ncbi:hypothetical protein D3C71_1903910 [compost metagenome]
MGCINVNASSMASTISLRSTELYRAFSLRDFRFLTPRTGAVLTVCSAMNLASSFLSLMALARFVIFSSLGRRS